MIHEHVTIETVAKNRPSHPLVTQQKSKVVAFLPAIQGRTDATTSLQRKEHIAVPDIHPYSYTQSSLQTSPGGDNQTLNQVRYEIDGLDPPPSSSLSYLVVINPVRGLGG